MNKINKLEQAKQDMIAAWEENKPVILTASDNADDFYVSDFDYDNLYLALKEPACLVLASGIMFYFIATQIVNLQKVNDKQTIEDLFALLKAKLES